jgi:chromosome partitioning protein
MSVRTIAVISQKGGSGKTTFALNLAVAAAQDGKRVLIVDLDPQASVTKWYEAREDKASLIVQPTHPAALDALKRMAAGQGVDWMIIDTAAGTDSNAAKAVEVSDLVLITCRPTVMDLRAIQNPIRLCRYSDITPRIVLTQIEPQGTVEEEAREQLQQLGAEVLVGGLGRRAAYSHSLINGLSAAEYEGKGKAAKEVGSLYKTVCHLVDAPSRRHATAKEA